MASRRAMRSSVSEMTARAGPGTIGHSNRESRRASWRIAITAGVPMRHPPAVWAEAGFCSSGLGAGNDLSSCPLSTSHTNSTLSWPPAMPSLPSALAAVRVHEIVAAGEGALDGAVVGVDQPHGLVARAGEHAWAWRPTKPIEVTSLPNGAVVRRWSPVMKSHTLITLSAPQLASTLPSALPGHVEHVVRVALERFVRACRLADVEHLDEPIGRRRGQITRRRARTRGQRSCRCARRESPAPACRRPR